MYKKSCFLDLAVLFAFDKAQKIGKLCFLRFGAGTAYYITAYHTLVKAYGGKYIFLEKLGEFFVLFH